MAEAFNLTAQLNLRGPSNIRQIVSDVKKQIGTITGEVKFKIDSSSINNTSRLNQSLQSLNTNLSNVASNAASASAAIKNFGQSVSGLGNSSAKLASNVSKAAKSTDDLGTVSSKASKNVAVARTEMEEFGRQSALAVRRFAAFSAVTGVFFSLSRAVNSGLKSFIEFDRQLVRLQQVTGQNAEGLKGLQDEISRLSIGLGVSSDSLIQVSSTLAQAGLSASETRAALEALAKSELAPSFDNINQTVEGSIALMRQFGISAKDLEKALGSVNAVAAAFAVESGDIIAAIQRTGGVFASASKGVSGGTDALNEFIAVFTSVRATTRESAETIATGLRTIFTRIQRAGTIEALKEFGVTLTDAEGKFVGAYKAVELLSQGLNKIDPRDLRFSQIVEELGGFRQIGKVIPLIQQFATAQEALKVAQAGQGSLATDAAKAQLSLANQISKVREEFLTLIRGLGQSDTFQTLAKGALGFASGLIKISGALKGILPALSILAAGASLRGLTQFTGGFIGGLKKVPQGGPGNDGQSVAGAIGSNLGATLVGAKTEQVSRDLDQNSVALDRVSGRLDNLTAGLNSLDTNLNSINNSLNAYNSILQQSIASLNSNTSSLDRLTDAINNFNPGGGGGTLRDGGKVLGFARGGTVPGSGKGDKVPAMLEPGEVVMSNKAVNRYGRGNLVRMNKYIDGGIVKEKIGELPSENKILYGQVKGFTTDDSEGEVETYINPRPIELTPQDFSTMVEYIRDRYKTDKKQFTKFKDQQATGSGKETPKSIYSRKSLSIDNNNEIEDSYISLPEPKNSSWAKGKAFEQLLTDKYGSITGLSMSSVGDNSTFQQIIDDHFAPLDFEKGDAKFEKKALDYFKLENKKNAKPRVILSKRFRDSQLSLPWTPNIDSFIGSKALEPTSVFYPKDPEKTKTDFDIFYEQQYNNALRSSSQTMEAARQSRAFAAYTGGLIQRFMEGSPGGVKAELTPGELALQKASASEIIRVLGAQKAATAAGVSVAEVNQLIRSKDPAKQSLRDAIDKEYIKVINRKTGGAKRQENRLSAQGLVVAGAGMFGSKFDKTEDIVSPLLSSSPKVRMIGGILSPKLAAKFDTQFGKASIRIANRASKQAMIYDVLDQLGMGRELNLDFDRTLAFGADKILSDPRTPAFSEFGDPKKVSAALEKAKLSSLGKELVKLVTAKPDLLPAMRVVTARPQSTLGLVQQWLSQKGLPIPLSQFKGFGGPNIDAANIANLKAAFLNPNSLFVDDDPRNIAAAEARGDVRTYQYGAKLSQPNINTDSTIQGGLLEKVIQNLGGPGTVKGLGFDFPDGLRGAAKYFGLPDDIPTDVKRTLSGPSTIKDNIVTYLKNVMGYNDGGIVQRFKDAGEVEAIQGMILGKGRGKEGVRGARPKVKELSETELAKLSTKALIAYAKKQARDVFTTGGAGMVVASEFVEVPQERIVPELESELVTYLGKRGFWREKIEPFASTPTKKAPIERSMDIRTLRGMAAAAGGLDKSAIEGVSTESLLSIVGTGAKRASPEVLAATVARYADDPEFIKQEPMAAALLRGETSASDTKINLDTVLQKVKAFVSGGSFAGVFEPEQAAKVKKAIERLKAQNEPKTKAALENFDSIIAGGTPETDFHKTAFQWAINQVFKKGLVQLRDGGSVQRFMAGGYKLGGQVYDLQKGTGLSNPEFDELVKYGNTNNFNDSQFRDYLANFLKNKQAKKDLRVNSEQLRQVLLSGTRTPSASQKQTDLARQLMGSPDAQYNPKYKYDSALKRAIGGRSPTFARGGTVPALVSNNEGYVPPTTAKSIGYGTLNKMNQADRNGMGRFSRGGISKFKGPGTGTSDSIRTNLPVGSYVIRAKAMNAMGFNKGGSVGVQRFAGGGSPKAQKVGTTATIAGFDLADDMLKRFASTGDKLTSRFLATTNIMSLGSFDFLMTKIGVAGKAFAVLDHNLKILDREVPGLAEAIIQNGLANQRSVIGQDSLISGLFKLDDANLALAKSTLEADTARRTASSSVPTSPPDSSTTSPAVNNSSQTSNRTLSREERKARKEQYMSQSRGGVTREDARKQGLIRSDFGEGQPSNPRIEKQKQNYIEKSTKPIKDDLKPQYQKLYDEEKQAIKAYYTAKVQQAQKEGKDVSGIISEYRSAVSEAKASMEAALRGEFNERVQQNTLPKTDSSPAGTDYVAIDKQPAEAANQAARELELLSTLASQSGMSLKDFTQDLQKQIGSAFIKLKDEMPKLIGSVRANVVQNRDKLTSSDAETKQNAAQSLGEDIRRAIGSSSVSGISNEQIDKFVADLQDKLQNTSIGFDEAINSVSGLKDALSDASNEAKLQARAVEAVSASSGAAKNALDNMAEAAINNAKGMKESEKLSSRLAKTALVVGAAGSALSSIVKAIGGSQNKSAIVSGAAIEGASSTASTLMAARKVALPGLDAASAMASKMGGPIGKLGSTLLPMVKNLIAGSFGSIATGAITLAGALKYAYNAARDFDLEQTKKRLDESISRVNNLFDEFSKDTSKLDILGKIDQELRYGSQQLIKNLQTDLTVPKAFWMNLLDVGLSSGGDQAQAAGRSMILEKEGSLGYLQASLDSNYQQRAIARLAPEKAIETAQKAQPQGQNILRQFENRLRSGSNMDDLLADLKIAGNESAQVLARMNPKINEQIMLLQNDNTITEKNRKAQIQQIVAAEATRVATVNMKNTMKQIEFEKLGRQTNNFAASLERMFNNMEQSINKVSFDLDKLSRSAELSAAALSGNAKAGDIMLESINVLQNPRAYSGSQQNASYDQAAGMFGSQAGLIRPLLGLGDKLESTVMRTINQTVAANPQSTTEGIAGNIGRALEKQLKDLGLPPNIADKLAGQTRLAFEKIRSERGGEDTQLNFDQVAEEVPAFAKAISSAQRAQELAVKAMEFYQKNVNDYAQAMNQMVEYQVEANGRMRKASEIQTKGNMELARTLGKRVTLDESRRAVDAPIKSMTGGLSDPRDIGRNVVNLENTRRVQQGSADSAANRGPAGKDEFALMQNRLRNTNVALRENIDALKQMADSTDLAQAALQKIQDVQAARQAGANLIEKMVTSSPEELARLNASIGRLNNNMKGGLNIGSTSEQRGETLQAFNMLAPMLGDGQKQNELKANVLESMLKESGIGIDSTFQGVLDSLRNPEADPQMAEAIGVYREAVNKQAQANTILGELQRLMAANTAEIAATKLATAIGNVKFTFEESVMNDIAKGIQRLVDIAEKRAADGKDPIPAAGKQKGGIIYASMGQAIDFASKGTDTVPAMLTPGEFVVNRAATRANLPLLQNINSGKYSNGGQVRYYNDGGYVLNSGKATTNVSEQSGKVAEKQKEVQTTKKVVKVPVIQDYKDSDLIKMGTINTNSFMATSNDMKSSTIGNGFESIELYEDIGYLSNNIYHKGEKQDKQKKYIKNVFWGIKNIDKILKPGEVSTDNNKDIVTKYKELLSKLRNGPESLAVSIAGANPDKWMENIGTTLPEIKPKIEKSNKLISRDKYLKRKISNIILNLNKQNYWGVFDKIQQPNMRSGIGFADKSYKLGDKPDNFAPGLEKVKAFANSPNDLMDSIKEPISYLRNTLSVISQVRGALKSLNQFDDFERDTYGIGKDDTITPITESSAGIKIKDTMASLDALYNKRAFSIDLDDPDYVREPITLYNLDQDKWNTIKASLQNKYDALVQNQQAPKDNTQFTRVSKVSDPQSFRDFPWISKSANIDSSIFASENQAFSTKLGKDFPLIEQISLGSENGKYFIPAQKIKAPFVDQNTRNFTKTQDYIHIASDAGVPELNPFYNKTGRPIVYKGTKEDLQALILEKLPKWDANTKTSINPLEWPNITLGDNIGLVNSLTKDSYPILKDIPDDKIPFLLRSNGDLPVLEPTTIDATAYSQGRDKRIEAAQLNQAKQNVEKVSGDRFNLSVEDKNFPAENRVKIAQAAQVAASSALGSYGITVPNISKIEDVGGVAGYLNSYLGRFDNKSPEWATIDSWRGLFGELFKPTPAAVGYLKSFGIQSNGEGADPDNFKKIINREIAFRVSKNISGEIPAEAFKDNRLELDSSKTKIYSVGPDGKRTLDQSEFVPKTMADIEKIALNPQNVFQDEKVRQNYLDTLLGFWNTNASRYPNDIAKGTIEGIEKLKTWYTAQDTLLNTGLNQKNLDAKLGLLSKPDEEPAATIANQTEFEKYNQLLTGGQYGSLPDTNRLIDLIKVRKEEAKNEEQVKQAEKPENFANGGLVYASNGTLVNFQPKGTDTVPAMLTPGEFVVNRASTQKYKPVLEAINNGNYNRGGIVNYLQNGGYLPIYRGDGGGANGAGQKFDFTSYIGDIVSKIGSGITEAIDKAIQNVKSPNTNNTGVSSNSQDLASIDNFVNRLNNIANILSNIYIPPQITITGKHDVVVTINGDTVLNQLQPDIQGIVTSSIKQAFRNLKANNPENNTIDFNIDSPNKK